MNETKCCSKCGEEKSYSEFHNKASKKDGLNSNCKECVRISNRKWAENNRERQKETSRLWSKENKERKNEVRREWRKTNREKDLEYNRKWQKRNRDYFARYARERRRVDGEFRLKEQIKDSLKRVLNQTGERKSASSVKMVGYDTEDLRTRIEYQFEEGMSWDNYGDWEIDHVISIQYFLNKGETRPHVINALSNLQPMWKSENRSKSDKFYKDYELSKEESYIRKEPSWL